MTGFAGTSAVEVFPAERTGAVSPRLQHLEEVIGEGARAFVEVGLALLEIRESRLYRERGFSRFSDYCQDRWHLSVPYANQKIQGARVARELEVTADAVIPSFEAHTRELAPLLKTAAEKIPQVWAEILEETAGRPTAPQIRAKVQSVLTSQVDESVPESVTRNGIVRKPLAVRVKEIKALAVDGASAPQIARQLGLGEQRVRDIIAQCGLVIPGDQVTNHTRRLDPNHVMEQTVAEIRESADTTIGLLQGRWSDLDPERIEEWRGSLEAAIKAINRLIKELSHVTA